MLFSENCVIVAIFWQMFQEGISLMLYTDYENLIVIMTPTCRFLTD